MTTIENNLDTGEPTVPDTGEPTVVEAKPEPITIAGKTYANQEEVNKALENANQTIDTLGNKVGDLKKQVTPPPKETEDTDTEPDYDPYDKGKMADWNAWSVRNNQKAVDAATAARAQKEVTAKQIQSIEQFASDHPDIVYKDLQAVTKFADSNNIVDMQTAYDRMVKKGMFSPPGTKDTTDKINEGDKVHKTMPDAGSGTPVETIDDATISKMTDKDPDFLGKLTPERRLQYLRSDNV